jgi:hypothetical protein
MPEGLDHASARVLTPRGEIGSRWRRDPDGSITLEISIPGACDAEVWLPNGGARLTRPPHGARWLGRQGDAAVYGLASGEWTLQFRS